jgi:hypothetical protein
MKDGKVSPAEYRVAFERYQVCMRLAGYPLSEVSMADGKYDYRAPLKSVSDGLERKCYDSEFGQVDRLWQFSLLKAADHTPSVGHG